MADPPRSQRATPLHLDASGSREVVYCHRCLNEWFRDEGGLECPSCHSEATEIITVDNDPREMSHPIDRLGEPPGSHSHSPWFDEAPDPDDDDPEDFSPRNGRSMHFSRTFHTVRPPREEAAENDGHALDPNDHTNVIREFREMIGHMMGPGLQFSRTGRSGPEALFSREEREGRDPLLNPQRSPFQEDTDDENRSTGPRRNAFIGGIASGPGGPHIIGQRFTFTTSRRLGGSPDAQDATADDLVTYAPPSSRSSRGPSFIVISITARPDQLARILGGIFGTMGVLGQIPRRDNAPNTPNADRGGFPPGLQGFFASLFNPANAVAGDAVYSQEALDRIISTLMEQHPTSNAPGPASEEAIASLPKKKLDGQMLGPELEAECSVCMDDVHVHDEVVVLPCAHWFHEACARAWLCEHNTCPICRKGIDGDQASRNDGDVRGPDVLATEARSMRRTDTANSSRLHSRTEARLSSIRDRDRLSPQEGGARRQQMGESVRSHDDSIPSPTFSGTYSSSLQYQDSEPNESQRVSRRSSDRSRRSSGSRTGGLENSNGPIAWLRRFGRRNDQDR